MRIGDRAEFTRAFSQADCDALTALTGVRPAEGHVPAPLIHALFSYLLGVKLPGPGTNYLKQDTEYLARAKLDAPLTARVEITRLRPEKKLVDLETTCRTATGALIARGRALVLVGDVAF